MPCHRDRRHRHACQCTWQPRTSREPSPRAETRPSYNAYSSRSCQRQCQWFAFIKCINDDRLGPEPACRRPRRRAGYGWAATLRSRPPARASDLACQGHLFHPAAIWRRSCGVARAGPICLFHGAVFGCAMAPGPRQRGAPGRSYVLWATRRALALSATAMGIGGRRAWALPVTCVLTGWQSGAHCQAWRKEKKNEVAV